MSSVDDDLARVGAVLVEERVLRRIIKLHRRIPGIGLQVPHEHCYWLPRSELAKFVEPHDISVAFDKLPERVTVIAHPHADDAWRLIFHTRIHEAFEERLATKQITTAVIRE